MTEGPPHTPAESDRSHATPRSAVDAWVRAADFGLAVNRTAARGLAASLRAGAALTEFNIDLTRDSVRTLTEANEQLVPLSPQAADAVANALDEAIAAVEASTADSSRAVAEDLLSGVDSAEAATTLQRNVQYALAIQLLGVEPAPEDGTEPIRIELTDGGDSRMDS